MPILSVISCTQRTNYLMSGSIDIRKKMHGYPYHQMKTRRWKRSIVTHQRIMEREYKLYLTSCITFNIVMSEFDYLK